MIRSTFQVIRGIGPQRERLLWQHGVTDWDDVRQSADIPLPAKMREALLPVMDCMEAALDGGDIASLAQSLPTREQWRLYRRFSDRLLCLDIETDWDRGVTVIGALDDTAPYMFLAGRNLDGFLRHDFRDRLLVTFNGSSFDVPVLKQNFPTWQAPRAHMDLRHVFARLGYKGGLKNIEIEKNLHRPAHLQGVDGAAAIRIWQDAVLGDWRALRLLVEYNLYDTINLRALAAMAYNETRQTLPLDLGHTPMRVPVPPCGDLREDLTKVLRDLNAPQMAMFR